MQEAPSILSIYRHIQSLNVDSSFQLPRIKMQSKDLIFTMDSLERKGSVQTSAKIADYTQIYGSRPRSTSKSRRSITASKKADESIGTMNASTGRGKSAGKRPPRSTALSSTANMLVKDKAREVKKEVERLEHSVAAAKSDRFELRRDIATYDHELSIKVSLAGRLASLASLANSLPDIFTSLNEASAEEQEVFDRLQADVGLLCRLEAAPTGPASFEVPQESFDLRAPNKAKTLEYFRGVHSISGLHCIIVITGNDLADHFQVKLQTCSGDEFGMSVRHKLMGVEVTPAVMREAFLPHFYLTFAEGDLKLNFDIRCSTEFMTLLTEVKGTPAFLNTIILTEGEEEDSVYLTLLQPPAELKLQKSKLTSSASLFDSSVKSLKREISAHLVYNRGTGELIWSSRSQVQTHTYSYKHQVSKLMDDSYVKEILEANFSIIFATEVAVAGRQVRLEVLAYRQAYKLKVACDNKVIELTSNSHEMKLLRDLQGFDLTNFGTLLKSLELEVVVARLLPKTNADN
jgi:hypothetical protein